jgi:hypothetical protein
LLVSLSGQNQTAMSVFVKVIPFIELLLVLAMLGLAGIGYLSLYTGTNQPDQNRYRIIGKWVVPGLIGLAVLAITLLLMVAFIRV